jgi:Na+:H+ antiporter, NhaA family
MSTAVLSHPVASELRGWTWPFRFATEHFLWLPIGGLIALVWVNLAPEQYFSVARPMTVTINDIGMTLFFAVVAQEVFEAVMPGGMLHTWRRWALPVAAAAGATACSAGIYVAYVSAAHEQVLLAGWPAATAIDLAFAYMLVRSLYYRHPAAPFLLVVGIVANVIGLFVIASRHAFVVVTAGGALLMLVALGTAFTMKVWRVASVWPYLLVSGPISWWALHTSGYNPALALLPIVPFLPHTPRRTRLFDDGPHRVHEPHHLEQILKYPVHVVLFLFGLVNAGVLLAAYGTGTWALLTASMVGKPVGLLAGTAAAVVVGLHMPVGLRWRDLVVVSLATCGGFAFALFFATAAIPTGPILGELKVGAILGGTGVPLAIAVAWAWRVGRFAHPKTKVATAHLDKPAHR